MSPENIELAKQQSNVVDLPVRTAPVANFTLVVSLPDGRQVSATTAYFDTPEGPDALIDRLMDSLERQRARAEIKEFDAKIEEHEETIEKAKRELIAVNIKADEQIAALKGEVLKKDQEYSREYDRLRAETESQGRQAFDPEKPGNKTKLATFVRAKMEFADEIKKIEETRTRETRNFDANMAMFLEAIAKAMKQREARIKIVG